MSSRLALVSLVPLVVLLACGGEVSKADPKSGAVKADVRQRFALKDAADAHRALEGRKTSGATILTP